MSTLHLRYALISAVAALAASVIGVAVYVAVEEPKATLLGVRFGLSLAPYGALLALPFGLLLSVFHPRVSRVLFVIVTTVVAMALGGVLGFWIASGSHILFQPISVFLASAWAVVACILATMSSRSPNKSLERTREG
jgi:hypothetical protein